MSNRPPFDDDELNFDDEDEFGNDDFDLGEDDASDEFAFEDDSDFDFDDNGEFSFDDDEDLTFEDEEAAGGGPSRTFIYIALAMIALFVIALIALVVLTLGGGGPTDIELTTTAIVAQNATTEALRLQTATQAVVIAMAATENAALTQTALAIPTDTPPPTATDTPPPSFTPDETQAAANLILTQTQQALFLEQTLAAAPTDTPAGPPTVPGNAVALTATALANLLQPTAADQGGGIATPTIEGGTPIGALPTALPDTGLFDDLAAGGTASLGGLALAMFGLVGLILVSRRLRSNT
jgi:hypothetical protein